MKSFNRTADQWEEVRSIISQYYGEWTAPDYPGAVNNHIPNTALLGNGDVGVSSDGDGYRKIFRISKGDFWEYNGCPLPIGRIAIGSAPVKTEGFASAHSKITADTEKEPSPTSVSDETVAFYEKEDILNAKMITRQKLAGIPMQVESWMSATHNLFVVEITSLSQTTEAEVTVTLEGHTGGGRPVTAEAQGDCMTVTRATAGADQRDQKSYTSKAVLVTRLVGGEGSYAVESDTVAGVVFKLPAEGKVYLVTAIGGGGQTYDCFGKLWEGRTEPVKEARALLDTVASAAAVDALRASHLEWWKDYWMQSYIRLDTSDPDLAVLQAYYYAAQYELGSGIREGKIAAGLYGIWHTTDTPNWHSDYHLNYNFISAYYPLATANRASMLLPAVKALMDYLPQGIENAGSMQQLKAVYSDFVRELVDKGQIDPQKGIPDAILFPVAIGPYGMTLETDSYHHETVNAPMSAYPLIEYYNHTRDETFMKDTLYVYLRYVLTFLAHWLMEEDGTYTLYAGYNEGSWSKNPALELAVYKMCLKYGISISEKLGVDAYRRETWQKIYDGLAPQPVVENYKGTGKTVLALAETEWNGSAWVPMKTPIPGDGNCIPLEAILPGEVFGYYSSEEELQILQGTVDTFAELGAWTQINNFPKLFTVAVNARYDCGKVVDAFATAIRRQMQPNMMIEDTIHGIEKAGATEAIHNMMLLSDQGVIKLFGNWLSDKNAEFVRLRASGAFLFSAAYDGKRGEITEGATVYSEAGATATVASLWEDGMVVLDENGLAVETLKGTAPNHDEITYTFATEAGKTYVFVKPRSEAGV